MKLLSPARCTPAQAQKYPVMSKHLQVTALLCSTQIIELGQSRAKGKCLQQIVHASRAWLTVVLLEEGEQLG